MPTAAHFFRRWFGALAALIAVGCSSGGETQQTAGRRMPRELIEGRGTMVIQAVEQGVSREEVSQAVQSLVTSAPVCMRWPSVWLELTEASSSVFNIRFDLMARDWGEDTAVEGEQRMDEFVAMGLLTKRDRPNIGPRVVEFRLTEEGSDLLQGSLRRESGGAVSFCGPAERRVLEIVSMEWGQYDCGSLRVRFTHVGDAWPAWAHTPAARAYLEARWPALGQPMEGSVSLSRLWYPDERLVPRAMGRNGALRSLCYDASRDRGYGDDLRLRGDAAAAEVTQ